MTSQIYEIPNPKYDHIFFYVWAKHYSKYLSYFSKSVQALFFLLRAALRLLAWIHSDRYEVNTCSVTILSLCFCFERARILHLLLMSEDNGHAYVSIMIAWVKQAWNRNKSSWLTFFWCLKIMDMHTLVSWLLEWNKRETETTLLDLRVERRTSCQSARKQQNLLKANDASDLNHIFPFKVLQLLTW